MSYFVSYDLIPAKEGVPPGQGTSVITNSRPSEVQSDLEAVVNDAGGPEKYNLRVICLTVLPADA